MPYEMLKNEVIGLSDEKIMILVEFARFLKQNSAVISEVSTKVPPEAASAPKRRLGSMRNDFVSIAEDFDTCLEGMEEYV